MSVKPNDIKFIVQTALLVTRAAKDLYEFIMGRKDNNGANVSKRIVDLEDNQVKSARILKDTAEEVKDLSIKVKSLSLYLKVVIVVTIVNVVAIIILVLTKI